ncbi:hypothetical protein BD410DRAFT_51905 [Rickenella mellea]|uniref:Uncharacterized protein n=1 Tax=Rickenella mellea TaxID=50990 RepID=A0A4R5XFZ2_9AGAM|nr:hypothetical protein BD410DRAFT_51905 [Rickenella mellea]
MKKSFRERVGSVVRRNSSFTGSRPSTPRASSDAGSDPISAAEAVKRAASPSSSWRRKRPSDESVGASAQATPGPGPTPQNTMDAPVTDKPVTAEPIPDTPANGDVEQAKATEAESVTPAADPAAQPQPDDKPEEEAKPQLAESSENQAEPNSKPAEEAPVPETAPAEQPIPLVDSPQPTEAALHDDNASSITPSIDPAVIENLTESPIPSVAVSTSVSAKPSRDLLIPDLSPIEESPAMSQPPSALPAPVAVPMAVTASLPGVAAALSRAAAEAGDMKRTASEGSGNLPKPYDARMFDDAPSYTSTVESTPAKGKEKEDAIGNGHADAKEETSIPAIIPMPVPHVTVAEASSYPFFADSDDPFRDPPSAMPDPRMSIPSIMDQEAPQDFSYHHITPDPVVMPLPPLNEVTSQTVRKVGSDYTLTGKGSRPASIQADIPADSDERRPLLSRDNTEGQADDLLNSTWPISPQTLSSLGWTEHSLPDTTSYFTHPALRTTTDIDLRVPKKLHAVQTYLDTKLPNEVQWPVAHEGWEMWLRDDTDGMHHHHSAKKSSGKGKMDEPRLVRCWVYHKERALALDSPNSQGNGEDILDLEYRYWSFMESHPAHSPLPANALADALDALTWAYTGHPYPDNLLKSKGPVRPPFSQEECKELLGVLRSLSGTETDVQVLVQTRIVSRILLRVAQWRQQHLRPDKPLPRDATTRAVHRHHRRVQAYRMSAMDVVLAWLCFGIPFFFANRHGYQRFDEESGMRTAGPFLVVGASACLVAAIILSASVTFLALPGLDNVARTAGFVAIIASIASLASSVLAFFRHQSDVARIHIAGHEGIFLSPQKPPSILLSLPTVFLAWSVIAFVTGIVLYAFRGAGGTDPHWTDTFAEYTRWTAVGVVAFSAGVLITSMVFVRK